MSYEKLVSDHTPEYEKEWGRYNDSLPNLQEITAEEFAQSGFFTWCFNGTEHRQISPENFNKGKIFSPVKTFVNAKIFFMNSPYESGFVIVNDYWAKKVRFFKFAKCFHDYKEITAAEAGKTAFNCYHYCRCTKCGQGYEYDSSG